MPTCLEELCMLCKQEKQKMIIQIFPTCLNYKHLHLDLDLSHLTLGAS